MVKIVARKLLSQQKVYDIGVTTDHNFLLANGLVASNCFNKSHSTAYAYVTYQTAYLKANYPVEYMTALLSASSGNQDKVEKYRENCLKMGITVEPPDINFSQEDFTPKNDKTIIFGLSAVKNLGQNAIENIIKARKEAEVKFTSLANFCALVDLRLVNRRALETLILCGAFDQVQPNRNQLIHDLDLVISWAQKKAKEQETGQTNLFDLLGVTQEQKKSKTTFAEIPSAPPVEDFSLQEKLKLEKEYLGFYISEHPLQSIQKAAQVLSPINLNQLPEQNSRKLVSAVVMINTVKKIITKKGTPMAFLQLEDISGSAEAVVFPNTYEEIEPLLQEDASLIVWGKADKRDDKLQLIINAAEPIAKVKMVLLHLSPEQAMNSSIQQNLKVILQKQSGERNQAKVPILATIGRGKFRQFVRLGTNFWVQDYVSAVTALQNAGFNVEIQSLLPTKV